VGWRLYGASDITDPDSDADPPRVQGLRMSPGTALVFWSLVLFQAKHFLADFVLQTRYQWSNKGVYGHPGGLLHAGIHAVGSLPAIFVLTSTPGLVAAILAAEFLVHYHVDWTKEQINKRRGLTHGETMFWVVFGADQFLHQLTYVIVLAVLARAAGL
jgi:Protein of unknown function (DUF3307)